MINKLVTDYDLIFTALGICNSRLMMKDVHTYGAYEFHTYKNLVVNTENNSKPIEADVFINENIFSASVDAQAHYAAIHFHIQKELMTDRFMIMNLYSNVFVEMVCEKNNRINMQKYIKNSASSLEDDLDDEYEWYCKNTYGSDWTG